MDTSGIVHWYTEGSPVALNFSPAVTQGLDKYARDELGKQGAYKPISWERCQSLVDGVTTSATFTTLSADHDSDPFPSRALCFIVVLGVTRDRSAKNTAQAGLVLLSFKKIVELSTTAAVPRGMLLRAQDCPISALTEPLNDAAMRDPKRAVALVCDPGVTVTYALSYWERA